MTDFTWELKDRFFLPPHMVTIDQWGRFLMVFTPHDIGKVELLDGLDWLRKWGHVDCLRMAILAYLQHVGLLGDVFLIDIPYVGTIQSACFNGWWRMKCDEILFYGVHPRVTSFQCGSQGVYTRIQRKIGFIDCLCEKKHAYIMVWLHNHTLEWNTSHYYRFFSHQNFHLSGGQFHPIALITEG